MIVADHELHSVQRPLPQAGQQLLPARQALATGELDRQNVPPTLPINADGDQHRLAAYRAIVPDLFVTGIQN